MATLRCFLMAQHTLQSLWKMNPYYLQTVEHVHFYSQKMSNEVKQEGFLHLPHHLKVKSFV